MKNFTMSALVALAFALCARHTSAQMTYTPPQYWEQNEVARHGPYWLFKPMAYNFSEPVIRQVSFSTNMAFPLTASWNPYQHPPLYAYPEYIPASQQANAGQYAEDVLNGQGIDSLYFGPWGDVSQGWSARVQILSMSYELIATYVLFTGVYTADMPVYQVTDPAIATPASISLYVNYANYVGGDANITRLIKVRVVRTDGAYDVTQTFQAGLSQLYASFSLPFNWQGEYCVEVWYEVYHNATAPEYWDDPLVIWRYQPPCFYHGISTGVGENEGVALSAFPNPFTDQVTIASPEATTYQVIRTSGQLVHTDRLMPGDNRLSFPGLAPGSYILRTENGQAVRINKE
jgi:hypothetical protein